MSDEDAPFDYDEEARDDTCDYCDGDGGDKWNDYILPCPKCGGDGRLTLLHHRA